jgi:hypothetical protein
MRACMHKRDLCGMSENESFSVMSSSYRIELGRKVNGCRSGEGGGEFGGL